MSQMLKSYTVSVSDTNEPRLTGAFLICPAQCYMLTITIHFEMLPANLDSEDFKKSSHKVAAGVYLPKCITQLTFMLTSLSLSWM